MAQKAVNPRHLAGQLLGKNQIDAAGWALIFGMHLHVNTLDGARQPGFQEAGNPSVWYVDVVGNVIVGVNIDPFKLGLGK